MANNSFEKFLYSVDWQPHNLSEIQKEYEQNDGDISRFRNKMFCPECEKAKLSFTHKTFKKRAYLSTLKTSNHVKGCSYNYDLISKRAAKKFVDNLTDKQVHDRLEAMLNQLLPREKAEKVGCVTDVEKNPFVIEVETSPRQTSRRAIPQKSMNSWFDSEDENKVFLFYGKVRLEVKKITTKKGERYKLIVKTERDNEWIIKTSIYRGVAKDAIDENKTYDLAVLGHLEFYNNLRQIATENFSAILYRESKG